LCLNFSAIAGLRGRARKVQCLIEVA